jgi:hypothetical protein
VDKVEFAKVMAVLVAGTGAKEPTPEQLDVYYQLLADLPINVLQTAAARALIEHRYPSLPPVGLIRQHAVAVTTPESTSTIADGWAAVQAFAIRWQYWLTEGVPSDPKTLANMEAWRATIPPTALRAAQSYGWQNIIEADGSVAFAHFRQLHESLDKRRQQEEALPPSVRTPAAATLIDRIGRMPALPE